MVCAKFCYPMGPKVRARNVQSEEGHPNFWIFRSKEGRQFTVAKSNLHLQPLPLSFPFYNTIQLYCRISDLETFVQYVAGLTDLQQWNAPTIFRIGHQLELTQLMENCVSALKQVKEMNIYVIQSLNLATEFRIKSLVDHIVKFIDESYGCKELISDDQYFLELNLDSAKVLNELIMGKRNLSWRLLYFKKMLKWSENYSYRYNLDPLLSEEVTKEIKTYFKMSLNDFETVDDFFLYHRMFHNGMEIFTENEYIERLKEIRSGMGCFWIKLSGAKDAHSEKYVVMDPIHVKKSENKFLCFLISHNPISFDDIRPFHERFLDVELYLHCYMLSETRFEIFYYVWKYGYLQDFQYDKERFVFEIKIDLGLVFKISAPADDFYIFGVTAKFIPRGLQSFKILLTDRKNVTLNFTSCMSGDQLFFTNRLDVLLDKIPLKWMS